MNEQQLLETNVEQWNQWRHYHPKWRPNLSGINLSRCYLFEVDLSGLNLSDADLSRTCLIGANLSRANLSRANLMGAYLSEADLKSANLSGTKLLGASLNSADLRGANLLGAQIAQADFVGAKFQPDRRSPRLLSSLRYPPTISHQPRQPYYPEPSVGAIEPSFSYPLMRLATPAVSLVAA
jgi:uncharacterized protein YjbI with pentapeptide repeats